MACMIRQSGMGMGGGAGSPRAAARAPFLPIWAYCTCPDLSPRLPHAQLLPRSSPLVALWQACFGPSTPQGSLENSGCRVTTEPIECRHFLVTEVFWVLRGDQGFLFNMTIEAFYYGHLGHLAQPGPVTFWELC